MSQTDKGVLIYNEWFESTNTLSGSEFKKLMFAVYRYQIYGKKPMKFKGKTAIVASMIFPSIDRRMACAAYGSAGAMKRKKTSSDNSDEALREASSPPESKAKLNEAKQSVSIYDRSRGAEKEKWQDFFDTATAHALEQGK